MRCIQIVLSSIVVAGSAVGQDTSAPQQPPVDPKGTQAQAAAPAGILPVPDYTGDLRHRRFLTGDWGGTRADWAQKGVQVDVMWNQYVQGVTDGGRERETRYGGNLDYLVLLDLQRMGLMPGALVKFRGESRYEESVNGAAGPILPVNTDAFFPLTDQLDEDIPFTITNLVYTQFLSEKFGVFLGKLDTLDGDANEFASGRGTSQFMNSAFVFNPALALRLPYSTLGGGLVWMPEPYITVTGSVVNTVDSSTTTGFDDFGDGTSVVVEASVQYKLGGLPGGQNLGALYSFDQDFTKLGGRLVFNPGEGLAPQNEDDTWAVYGSKWQYCYVEEAVAGSTNLGNGEPDHQGVGFFGRVGFADEDTNPIEWSVSGGVGGRGIIPSRDDDTFGVGYYYSRIQTLRLSGIAGIKDESQGFEAFYNFAITPAAHLTVDAQLVEAPSSGLDDAVVLGLRLGLRF